MGAILDVEKNLGYLNVLTVDKTLNTITEKVEQPSNSKVITYIEEWEKLSTQGYHSTLTIKQSPPKGLGVFADKNYPKSSVLEYCHCIASTWKGNYIQEPSYRQYAYWDSCNCKDCKAHGKRGVILLGSGSIVNSAATAAEANVEMIIISSRKLTVIAALKDIEAGEELLAWHGEGYYNNWCKPAYTTPKSSKLSSIGG